MYKRRIAPAIKFQKGFAPLIILIFVAVLVGLGYFSYKNIVKKPTPSPQTHESAKPLTSADMSGELETYSNSKYGFSFNYPSGFVIKTETELNTNTGEDSVYLVNSNVAKAQLKDAIVKISIIRDLGNFKNVGEYFESLKKITKGEVADWDLTNPRPIKLRSFYVNGKESVEIYAQSTDSQSNNYLSHETTIKNDEELLVSITEIERGNTQEMSKIYNQILSTFKFTN